MPIKILATGASVIVDDEDWDLVTDRSWAAWKLCPSGAIVASAKEARFGREFRLMLHREVVLRARPELIGRYFRVTPLNGDYLDCRRENLDVRVKKKGVGRPKKEPRPQGSRIRDYRGGTSPMHQRPTSPAWAGGYEYLTINRDHLGEGFRVRKCINGKPVD